MGKGSEIIIYVIKILIKRKSLKFLTQQYSVLFIVSVLDGKRHISK